MIVASDAIPLAIIAALSSVISAAVLFILGSWQKRADRNQQWARDDEVARKAAEVADQAAKAHVSTDSQLKQIHTLVNSDMTAARQSELTATQATLVLMQKVVAMNTVGGQPPSASDTAAMAETEARIVELRAILADRLAAQKLVDAVKEVAHS